MWKLDDADMRAEDLWREVHHVIGAIVLHELALGS